MIWMVYYVTSSKVRHPIAPQVEDTDVAAFESTESSEETDDDPWNTVTRDSKKSKFSSLLL